jgi:stress-induced morphogen
VLSTYRKFVKSLKTAGNKVIYITKREKPTEEQPSPECPHRLQRKLERSQRNSIHTKTISDTGKPQAKSARVFSNKFEGKAGQKRWEQACEALRQREWMDTKLHALFKKLGPHDDIFKAIVDAAKPDKQDNKIFSVQELDYALKVLSIPNQKDQLTYLYLQPYFDRGFHTLETLTTLLGVQCWFDRVAHQVSQHTTFPTCFRLMQ